MILIKMNFANNKKKKIVTSNCLCNQKNMAEKSSQEKRNVWNIRTEKTDSQYINF